MAKAVKVSDKQAICKKLMVALKKRYVVSIKKETRPVLETILFACCLENAEYDAATEAYDHLLSSFHDLNEVRVSSITEVEHKLNGLDQPEWRALRIRSSLQYVFEKKYEFEFEGIKRKTLELAAKNLAKIPNLTPFAQTYTLFRCLGGHIVPLDDCMTNAAIWLGFVDPKMDVKQATEAIKPALKKPDTELFCVLLRQLSLDPKLRAVFDAARDMADEDGNDLLDAPNRLNDLFKSPAKFKPKSKPKAKAKAAPEKKKPAAKKTAGKKAAAKATPAKKSAKVSKPAVKKTAKKVAKKVVKKAARKVVKKKPTKKKK